MEKKSTEQAWESSPTWEGLEAFSRHWVQRLLQRVLEEEVDSVLGRERYERRAAVDAAGESQSVTIFPQHSRVDFHPITMRRGRGIGSDKMESGPATR